jgi:hypothetical protein
MDKREQHRMMMKEIAGGTTRFVFYSRKLSDEQARNCKFCGELFFPGKQADILERKLPPGHDYWRRTLCSQECAGLRRDLKIRQARQDAIKNTRVRALLLIGTRLSSVTI